jgi:hypothetical protein
MHSGFDKTRLVFGFFCHDRVLLRQLPHISNVNRFTLPGTLLLVMDLTNVNRLHVTKEVPDRFFCNGALKCGPFF